MGICVSCRRRERKAPEKRSVPGAGGPAKGAAAAELLPRRTDRLPTMANSMSNIKMTNPIKGIVSKRRRRYQKDGFNLDLAYITDRLIAMGFPADKLEGVYRNHIDEVYRFLEKMHKDHYKIYNLCSERKYDVTKFHERVETYAFEDHSPPKIEIIQPFCEDVDKWLNEDPSNVAAVHCKAGKGRTGTMVCCYLLYSGQQPSAEAALKFYGTKRAHDEKGVTIPSQRRYVEYYALLLRSGLQYTPSRVHIRELIMTPAPSLNGATCSPDLAIMQAEPPIKAPAGDSCTVRAGGAVGVRLNQCTPLCGDVRVDVFNKPKMKMRKEKLFHFWFNTFFVTAELADAKRIPPLSDSPGLETYKLTLDKWQLDDAHKDKQNKHYTQDFKVELIIVKLPESSTFLAQSGRATPPSSTASSCSEPDTETDGHWDSGTVPYTRLADRDVTHCLLTAPESPDDFTDYTLCSERASRDCCDAASVCRKCDDIDGEGCRKCDETDASNSEVGAAEGLREFAQSDRVLEESKCDYRPDSLLDDPMESYPKETKSDLFYPDPFYVSDIAPDSFESDQKKDIFLKDSENDCYKLPGKERPEDFYKMAANGKKSESISRTRLSLGDVRASWREFSGKFSESRKKKDDS